MDYIKYSSTYKAAGKDYEKIVIWNRYFRNPTELILTFLPAIVSIYFLAKGYRAPFPMTLYFIAFAYPFFSFAQCRSAIRYHLAHRDAMEGAACEFTLTDLGILVEFPDYEEKLTFRFEDFTTIYDKLGYYMFFTKGDMKVMLSKKDMPGDMAKEVRTFIHDHIDRNTCLFR